MLYPLLTRGGRIKLVHQWTRNFSTMSAKPDKTSSNMLSSHILYWIVGSVCLEEPLRDRLFLCAGGWVTVMTQPYWALWYEQQPLQLLWLDPQLQVRKEERGGTCRRGRSVSLCWDNDGTTSQHRKWHWTLCHRCDEWEVLIIPQQSDKPQATPGQAKPSQASPGQAVHSWAKK